MRKMDVRNAVTAVIAAAALLVGFALGRVSVMKTNQNVPGAETETLVSDNTDTAGTTQEQPEENSSEGDTVPEKDLNSDLKDAADQEYASKSQTSELIRHEAQTEIPTEITTIDPSEIETRHCRRHRSLRASLPRSMERPARQCFRW